MANPSNGSGSGWSPLIPNATIQAPATNVEADDGVDAPIEEPTAEELAEDPLLAQDGENFFDAVTEMWDDPAPDENAPKPLTQAEIDANNTSAATRLDAYVKSIDLGVVIDPEKFKAASEANDPKLLSDSIQEAQQKAYKRMLQDMTRMVSEVRTELRSEMDGAAQRRLQVSASEQSLIEALPFLKGSKGAAVTLRPIAMAVKARFLKRGFGEEKANALTKRYFQDTAALTTEALDDERHTRAPGVRPGDRGFNNAPPQRGRKSSDETDWLGVLTGRPSK